MDKNRFLIASKDESVVHRALVVVLANDGAEALQIYMRQIASVDSVFRDWVLNLAANMSFAERFHITTDLELERLQSAGVVATEPEIVRSRIRAYFGERTDLCNLYLRYMDTEDPRVVTDELFEFISVKQEPDEHGLVAVDIDAIKAIE